MQNKHCILSVSISLLLLTSTAYAEKAEFEDGFFELKAAVGPTWLDASSTDLQPSPYDPLHATFSTLNALNATLGVGYTLPLCSDCDEEFLWLPFIKASIDVAHQFEETFSGQVDLIGWTDEWNNNSTIENTTLMFDISLGLFQYDDISVFILGGIGPAWTEVSFNAEPITPVKPYHYDEHNTTTCAVQGGAGVGYLIAPHLNLTGTWLYTHIGDIKLSDEIENGEFELNQQTVFIGLEWQFN